MVQLANLLLYADSVYMKGISFAGLFDPSITACNVNTGILLLSLLVAGLAYLYLGYYLNKVVKHRYGKREECCYCIKNNRIIPVDAEEEDPAVSVTMNREFHV